MSATVFLRAILSEEKEEIARRMGFVPYVREEDGDALWVLDPVLQMDGQLAGMTTEEAASHLRFGGMAGQVIEGRVWGLCPE